MSKYRVDGGLSALRDIEAATMIDPVTGVETARFARLQRSECFKDLLTNTVVHPHVERTGSHLRSLSVRLPKPSQPEYVHADGSGFGSWESN